MLNLKVMAVAPGVSLLFVGFTVGILKLLKICMHNELLSNCALLGCRSHWLRSHNLVLQKCSALPHQDFAEAFALGDFRALTDGHHDVDVARYIRRFALHRHLQGRGLRVGGSQCVPLHFR